MKRSCALGAAFVAIGLAAIARADSQPEPRIVETVTYYELHGTTGRELNQQIRTVGPIGQRTGRRFAATAKWNVKWNYPYARDGAGCRTGPVRTTVTVSIILPRWIPVRTELEPEWNRYSSALRAHEDGHRDIGVAAAREIATTLAALPPQISCDALEEQADAEGRRLLEEAYQHDADYDEETNHGVSQGARLR